MEHRFGQRQAVQLKTKIYFERMPPLIASTRNISRHGLNLSLTHPELEPNRVVNVVLSDFNEDLCWETRALVVHASEKEGTGMVLAENLPEDFYGVREDMPAAQVFYAELQG